MLKKKISISKFWLASWYIYTCMLLHGHLTFAKPAKISHSIFANVQANSRFAMVRMASGNPELVQEMAWYWTSNKPLSEPMMPWFTDVYMYHSAEMSSPWWPPSSRQEGKHLVEWLILCVYLLPLHLPGEGKHQVEWLILCVYLLPLPLLGEGVHQVEWSAWSQAAIRSAEWVIFGHHWDLGTATK